MLKHTEEKLPQLFAYVLTSLWMSSPVYSWATSTAQTRRLNTFLMITSISVKMGRARDGLEPRPQNIRVFHDGASYRTSQQRF